MTSELQLQSRCWQWAWNHLPQTRRLLIHVPNGGYRNKREAMELKASGVVAGTHDLLFFWKGKLYWFELKVGTNRQSSEQIKFGQAMTSAGAKCYEIRDFETFKSIMEGIVL